MALADLIFRDRSVYLDAANALVVADLHIGRGAASTVDLPLGERGVLPSRLTSLLDRFDPDTVVFAGDVLHSFSTLPNGVDESVRELREAVRTAGASLSILRGNHDTMLDSLADPEEERRFEDGTVVCHGHEAPSADAQLYVIGHDHPAIEIEGQRRPCYLWGEAAYRDADVLMLPAFNELVPGVSVNKLRENDAQSPLLAGIDAFRPVVRDDVAGETLPFPPLGSMREFL